MKGENVSGCGDSRREELEEEVRKPMARLQIRVPPLTDAGRSTPVAESLHLQMVLKVPKCHLLVICPPQSDFTSLSLILHICKMRIRTVFGLRMRGKHGDYSMYHSTF